MGFKVQREEEKPLTFMVSSDLHARFKKVLAFSGVSQKELLTQMVEHCLDDLEKEMPDAQTEEKQDDRESVEELKLDERRNDDLL